MNRVRSSDAEIAYEVLGDGPPVVLLHPFPAHHGFWLPAAQALLPRYRLILPDLRAHGESEAGEGPTTMEKHAADLISVCDDAGIERAIFAGVSGSIVKRGTFVGAAFSSRAMRRRSTCTKC